MKSGLDLLLEGIHKNKPALFREWQKNICKHPKEAVVSDWSTRDVVFYCTDCQKTIEEPNE